MFRSFGIHEKKVKPDEVDLSTVTCSVKETTKFIEDHVRNAVFIQNIASQVTNGPQGTISSKTQKSMKLLFEGVRELDINVKEMSFNHYNVKAVSLLTTVVENLHAVSHLKHQTFSVLEYARDFSTIILESIKNISSWSVKYFTNPNSYYPIPDSNMKLKEVINLKFEGKARKLSKDEETEMINWTEQYRPVRQRSVRDETTKDKAGTLPICLYKNQEHRKSFKPFLNFERTEETGIEAIRSEIQPSNPETSGIRSLVPLIEENSPIIQPDQDSEYDTDSDLDDDGAAEQKSSEEFDGRRIFTKSGRVIRAVVRLDL